MIGFKIPALGKAVPYGVYDIAANAGWVSVGIDHDTAAFAVESIRLWWHDRGQSRYPRAKRRLITADCGGRDGARVRLWKWELQKLANEIGVAITVAHLPPGTSKWNRIEHRLFAFITQNWRGKPLLTHKVIVQLIASTTTTPPRTKPRKLIPPLSSAMMQLSLCLIQRSCLGAATRPWRTLFPLY